MTPDESIRVSSHALKRWNERSSVPSIYPAAAWNDAYPILGTDFHADEVRHHESSGTVLLRKGRTLVTVIDVDSTTPQTRAAINRIRG